MGFRHLSFHLLWRFSQFSATLFSCQPNTKKNCSQLDHKIIIKKKKKKSKSICLPVALSSLPAPPTGSAAEDLRSPARPAACAGSWLCSEAPCCIQWCEPFHRRPHPSAWTDGSSAETLLQTTDSDQSLPIKPWLKSISNLAVKVQETTWNHIFSSSVQNILWQILDSVSSYWVINNSKDWMKKKKGSEQTKC